MPEGNTKPYRYLWMHEDGNFYCALKLPYAGESEMFLVYDNGFHIPTRMIFGY